MSKAEEKKEGRDSGGRGKLENRIGRVAWTICRGEFSFFLFLWRSAKPTDTFQVSSALKKKEGPCLLQEGCRDNVV